MEVVEYRPDLHLGRVGEHLVAVQTVFVDGHIAVQCQFEHIGKQVQLLVDGFHGVVESCIGIVVEVQLAIDVTTPYHILGHFDSRGERQAGTHRHTLILRLLLFLLLLGLLLLLSASLRLRGDIRRN